MCLHNFGDFIDSVANVLFFMEVSRVIETNVVGSYFNLAEWRVFVVIRINAGFGRFIEQGAHYAVWTGYCSIYLIATTIVHILLNRLHRHRWPTNSISRPPSSFHNQRRLLPQLVLLLHPNIKNTSSPTRILSSICNLLQTRRHRISELLCILQTRPQKLILKFIFHSYRNISPCLLKLTSLFKSLAVGYRVKYFVILLEAVARGLGKVPCLTHFGVEVLIQTVI